MDNDIGFLWYSEDHDLTNMVVLIFYNLVQLLLVLDAKFCISGSFLSFWVFFFFFEW